MTRFLSLGLLSLLVIGQPAAFVVGQGPPPSDLAGLWRQQSENGSVSFFELTPKEGHTYAAQEYGLGGVSGTARLEDGHLVIRFVYEGDNCHYTQRLRGGQGRRQICQDEQGHGRAGGHQILDPVHRKIKAVVPPYRARRRRHRVNCLTSGVYHHWSGAGTGPGMMGLLEQG